MRLQTIRSWYVSYVQLPWLPERPASWLVPLLWRRWSPTFDATEELRFINGGDRFITELACGDRYYRALLRPVRGPWSARSAVRRRDWLKPAKVLVLYLHGTEDGCTGLAERGLTQDDIAQLVDAHRTNVSRVLAQFARRDWIRPTAIGWCSSTSRRSDARFALAVAATNIDPQPCRRGAH